MQAAQIRAQAVAQLAVLRAHPPRWCRSGAHTGDPSCHAPEGTPASRRPQIHHQPRHLLVGALVAVPLEVWAATAP